MDKEDLENMMEEVMNKGLEGLVLKGTWRFSCDLFSIPSVSTRFDVYVRSGQAALAENEARLSRRGTNGRYEPVLGSPS